MLEILLCLISFIWVKRKSYADQHHIRIKWFSVSERKIRAKTSASLRISQNNVDRFFSFCRKPRIWILEIFSQLLTSDYNGYNKENRKTIGIFIEKIWILKVRGYGIFSWRQLDILPTFVMFTIFTNIGNIDVSFLSR